MESFRVLYTILHLGVPLSHEKRERDKDIGTSYKDRSPKCHVQQFGSSTTPFIDLTLTFHNFLSSR